MEKAFLIPNMNSSEKNLKCMKQVIRLQVPIDRARANDFKLARAYTSVTSTLMAHTSGLRTRSWGQPTGGRYRTSPSWRTCNLKSSRGSSCSDTALLVPQDKLRMLHEILARIRSFDMALEEFRKLLEKPINHGKYEVVNCEGGDDGTA